MDVVGPPKKSLGKDLFFPTVCCICFSFFLCFLLCFSYTLSSLGGIPFANADCKQSIYPFQMLLGGMYLSLLIIDDFLP